MKTNVKFIRLKTNDDIITESIEHYNSDDEVHFYQFINPLRVVYFNNPNTGGMAVGLVNWISSVFAPEQVFNIDKNDILVIADVSNDMINNYYSTLEDIQNAKDNIEMEAMSPANEELEEEEGPEDKKMWN